MREIAIMTKLLGWFTPVRAYASLAVFAFVAVALFGLYAWGASAGRAAEAKRQAPVIADLSKRLGQCRATVATQADALKAQNAAIDQLQADAEQRAKTAEQAIRQAQIDARKYRDRAAAIARAKPKTDDLCKAADDLITSVLSEERR